MDKFPSINFTTSTNSNLKNWENLFGDLMKKMEKLYSISNAPRKNPFSSPHLQAAAFCFLSGRDSRKEENHDEVTL